MDKEQAVVFYRLMRAGLLTKKQNSYEFVYDNNYLLNPDAMPISLAMPLREEKFETKDLFPFFDGLLPEGWLLDLTCAVAKIDKNDKFRLLMHTGEDPVGAISLRPLEDLNGK